jgi:hypothetical protein
VNGRILELLNSVPDSAFPHISPDAEHVRRIAAIVSPRFL